MEIKEVSSEGLKKKLEVSVSSAVISQKADDAIESATKTASIAGFRKGHVPFDALKRMHGKAFLEDAKRNYFSDIFDELIKDNKYRIASQPKVDIKEDGDKYVYSMEFEVFPEVQDIDLSKISVNVKKPIISEKDIETEMKTVFDNANNKWSHVTRNAANGDKITIKYTAKFNKKVVDQKQNDIRLGDLPEFDKNLLDHKIGDKLEFDYQYEKDGKKGRLMHYNVEIVDICEPAKYSSIEGDFLNDNGFKDLEEFKNMIKARLQHDADLLFTHRKSDDIVNKLIAETSFEVPESMKTQESKYVFDEFVRGNLALPEGTDVKDAEGKMDPAKLTKELVKVAEQRIRIRLILNKIGEKLGIKVSPKEINKRIKELNIDPSKVNDNVRDNVELEIFEDKVCEEIEKNIIINEEEVDVETFKSWISAKSDNKSSSENK